MLAHGLKCGINTLWNIGSNIGFGSYLYGVWPCISYFMSMCIHFLDKNGRFCWWPDGGN